MALWVLLIKNSLFYSREFPVQNLQSLFYNSAALFPIPTLSLGAERSFTRLRVSTAKCRVSVALSTHCTIFSCSSLSSLHVWVLSLEWWGKQQNGYCSLPHFSWSSDTLTLVFRAFHMQLYFLSKGQTLEPCYFPSCGSHGPIHCSLFLSLTISSFRSLTLGPKKYMFSSVKIYINRAC